MEPVQPGFNYFDTSLPLESMVVDGSVRLRSGQGTWAPFELWGAGVEDLTLSGEKFWTFTEGEPLEITWEPPASVGRGEIHLGVNIDQHGTSPTTLYCTFPDTGSATLPADMIEGLFEAGVTGWPVGSVRRRTADRADVGEGCVDLVVSSFESVEVVVAGYIPCDNAHPCPDGMECNYEIELCE